MPYPTKTDRARILATALQQVEEHGVENLAIRCVAAKIGVAPNALYRYFDSLTSLQEAVAEEVRFRMLETMRLVAADKEPAEAIYAISKAYLRFAHEQPRAFALFLRTSGAGCVTPQCIHTNEFLLEQVTRVYGEERGKVAALSLWAFLQGLAVLHEANILCPDALSASLKFGLDMWIDGAPG